jgi:hypothetical protein
MSVFWALDVFCSPTVGCSSSCLLVLHTLLRSTGGTLLPFDLRNRSDGWFYPSNTSDLLSTVFLCLLELTPNEIITSHPRCNLPGRNACELISYEWYNDTISTVGVKPIPILSCSYPINHSKAISNANCDSWRPNFHLDTKLLVTMAVATTWFWRSWYS